MYFPFSSSLLAAGFFFKGHQDECLVIANANGVGYVEKKARQGGMAAPILLQAKQSLPIIPVEISREKQTASKAVFWLGIIPQGQF